MSSAWLAKDRSYAKYLIILSHTMGQFRLDGHYKALSGRASNNNNNNALETEDRWYQRKCGKCGECNKRLRGSKCKKILKFSRERERESKG